VASGGVEGAGQAAQAGRLWLNDASCVRRRPEYPRHVWSYDFLSDRTAEGRSFRVLAVIDEYTRECLALVVRRNLSSEDVLETLTDLFVSRGTPVYLRSDNGPEFTATAVRNWPMRLDVQTLFIEPRSPWENGYVESFNGKLRDELLEREIFYTMAEAQVLIERWRVHYNQARPHSSLGYRPPAPAAVEPQRNLTLAMAGLT
jgi:putative transposase